MLLKETRTLTDNLAASLLRFNVMCEKLFTALRYSYLTTEIALLRGPKSTSLKSF